MPTFIYSAYSEHGELAEGRIEAPSPDAASELLWAQGLVSLEIRPADGAGVPWWRREVFASRSSSRSELASFTREFATLFAAGIPLDDVLRILADQASSAKMRILAAELLTDVLSGSSLSDAMRKHAQLFDADYVSVIRAGEIGGTVGRVFDELATLLERRAEVQARIRSALTYPAILLVLSVASLAVIVGVLIPNIAPLFGEGGRRAPSAIRAMLVLHDYWPEVLIGLTGMILVAVIILQLVLRKPGGRLALDRAKLRLPLLGPFFLKQETARFARTLGTLLRAGVPLLQASQSAGAVVANRSIATGIEVAIGAVREGMALHQALRAHTVIGPSALRMIAIGEEAGRLDQMLLRTAEMFEQQTQRAVDRGMTLLAPAMTLFIAVLVGGLIMTVMNAVLSLNDLALR